MICEKCGAALQKSDTGYECPECGLTITDSIAKDKDLKSYAGAIIVGILLAAICYWFNSSGYVLSILGIRLTFAFPLLIVVFAGFALLGAVGLATTYFDIGDHNGPKK